MSGIWFTSDLHLGHVAAAKFRNFADTYEHDMTIVENINSKVQPRHKLFILGDVVFADQGWSMLRLLNVKTIEIILGNHDKYPINKYLSFGKVHGFRQYKNFWLSHCPIHPNEMYRCKVNLHGHVHHTSNSERIKDNSYFNVNIDMNNMQPVKFTDIIERFDEQ